MNNNDLNRLTNALLSAFLDKAPFIEVGAICAEYGTTPASKIFGMATDRACKWMENWEYDLLDHSNRDKIVQQGMANMAKQHGAVLGKDYSQAQDGGYLLTNDLMDKITAGMSPNDLQLMRSKGQIKAVSNDPYAMLDKHLGVPFFDSLLATLAIRFKSLNDGEVSFYLGVLLDGMVAANPFLEDGKFFPKIFHLLGDRFQAVKNAQPPLNDTKQAVLVWCDLLSAMGVLELDIDEDGVFWVSQANLRSLDRVWHGSAMRPAILADKLASAKRGRGFG